jgi:hypothetical protein
MIDSKSVMRFLKKRLKGPKGTPLKVVTDKLSRCSAVKKKRQASSWGLFAVGAHLGAPIEITIGALLSASAAGSHSCFFSDSTVLSAQVQSVAQWTMLRHKFPMHSLVLSLRLFSFSWLVNSHHVR